MTKTKTQIKKNFSLKDCSRFPGGNSAIYVDYLFHTYFGEDIDKYSEIKLIERISEALKIKSEYLFDYLTTEKVLNKNNMNKTEKYIEYRLMYSFTQFILLHSHEYINKIISGESLDDAITYDKVIEKLKDGHEIAILVNRSNGMKPFIILMSYDTSYDKYMVYDITSYIDYSLSPDVLSYNISGPDLDRIALGYINIKNPDKFIPFNKDVDIFIKMKPSPIGLFSGDIIIDPINISINFKNIIGYLLAFPEMCYLGLSDYRIHKSVLSSFYSTNIHNYDDFILDEFLSILYDHFGHPLSSNNTTIAYSIYNIIYHHINTNEDKLEFSDVDVSTIKTMRISELFHLDLEELKESVIKEATGVTE